MGSGGSSSGGKSEVRYAGYIEDRHKVYLNLVAAQRALLIDDSPFDTFTNIDIDTPFLGAGIAISSFGSLFSKFTDYIEDADINALYDTAFNRTVNSQNVKDLVVAEGALLSDEIETNVYPRFMTGARDLNAVMSSTYVIGKSNLEADRLRSLAKYSAELKYKLLSQVLMRWQTTLEWNKGIVEGYARYLQLYFAATFDASSHNMEMKVKDYLWPFTVLDYERSALSALQGAISSKGVAGGEVSTAGKAIGGALSGAAAGAMVGSAVPGIGTAIGAAVGGVVGGLGGALM